MDTQRRRARETSSDRRWRARTASTDARRDVHRVGTEWHDGRTTGDDVRRRTTMTRERRNDVARTEPLLADYRRRTNGRMDEPARLRLIAPFRAIS